MHPPLPLLFGLVVMATQARPKIPAIKMDSGSVMHPCLLNGWLSSERWSGNDKDLHWIHPWDHCELDDPQDALFPSCRLMSWCVPPPNATQQVPLQQEVFVNEVHVMNGSSWPVEIKVEPKAPSSALQGSQFMLRPGETKLIDTYSVGGTFVPPVQRMTVTGWVTNKRGKKKQVGVLMMEQRQVDPERKAWFYHVMPNGGRIGFGF